jgi:hypothetical protein
MESRPTTICGEAEKDIMRWHRFRMVFLIFRTVVVELASPVLCKLRLRVHRIASINATREGSAKPSDHPGWIPGDHAERFHLEIDH